MVKLDLKDKKLLYWLDQNSRMTNRELGRKISLTEQAIGYKIKRLQEEGIIKKFVTFVNTLSLGYQHYKVFLKLHNTTESIENELIKSLVSNKNIRWVVSTSGKYDLSFSALALNPEDFVKIYNKVETKYGKYILEKNIATNIYSPQFTREYLLEGKNSKKREYEASKKAEIDDIDIKIIKCISQDSRKNVVDIAEEISETLDIVRYRLKKLQEKEILQGFTTQLDLEKIGREYYSVFFNAHNLTEETESRMTEFIRANPGIIYFVKVIGNYDFQLEIEAKDYSELDQILGRFRREFTANINDFEILRVKKEFKYDFYPF